MFVPAARTRPAEKLFVCSWWFSEFPWKLQENLWKDMKGGGNIWRSAVSVRSQRCSVSSDDTRRPAGFLVGFWRRFWWLRDVFGFYSAFPVRDDGADQLKSRNQDPQRLLVSRCICSGLREKKYVGSGSVGLWICIPWRRKMSQKNKKIISEGSRTAAATPARLGALWPQNRFWWCCGSWLDQNQGELSHRRSICLTNKQIWTEPLRFHRFCWTGTSTARCLQIY